MTVDLVFRDGKELEKKLKRLGERIERNVASSATRAAASTYRREMKKVLPRGDEDGKHIADSVIIAKSRRRKVHIVGVGGGKDIDDPVRYAHKLEFDKRGEFAQYNRLWTRTFEYMIPDMIQAMAKKLRAGIKKHGG